MAGKLHSIVDQHTYLGTVPLRYNVALARDIFLDSRSHHARLVSSVQACYQKVALRFVYN